MLAAMLMATGKLAAQESDSAALARAGIEPDVVSYPEYPDPLIKFNRAIFGFNDVSYRYVLIPAARSYQHMPAPVRSGIANFFNNIRTPIPLVNHLIQGKPGKAGIDLIRFAINSTVGVVGLFDPAAAWFHLERTDTSLSDTLIQYGMSHGVYLVLPLAGPSNVRDGTAMFADGYLNPLGYLLDNPESIAVRGFDGFQEFAPSAPGYLELRSRSADLYIFMRNMHLQGVQRDAEYR
jgi:phospholipid-binding lipoprotein MlaA